MVGSLSAEPGVLLPGKGGSGTLYLYWEDEKSPPPGHCPGSRAALGPRLVNRVGAGVCQGEKVGGSCNSLTCPDTCQQEGPGLGGKDGVWGLRREKREQLAPGGFPLSPERVDCHYHLKGGGKGLWELAAPPQQLSLSGD